MVKSFQLAFQDVAGNWSFDSIDRMYHDSEFKHALWFTLLLVVVIVPLQFVIAFVMALIVNANAQRTRPHPLHLHPAARRLGPRGGARLAADLHRPRLPEHDPRAPRDHRPAEDLDRPDPLQLAARRGRPDRDVAVDRVHHDHPRRGAAGHPEGVRRGGGGLRRRASSSAIRNVTLPMLKPALQVALLFRIIFAFEVFASVIAITGPREDDARRRVAALAERLPRPPRRLGVRPADPRALARRRRHRGQGPADAEGEAAAMSSVGLTEPQLAGGPDLAPPVSHRRLTRARAGACCSTCSRSRWRSG